jgi:hypothetical protein
MKKILVLAAVSISLFACLTVSVPLGQPAPAPAGSVVLGERSVDFRADQETINIDASEGLFRSLFFTVENNDLEIFNLFIVYGNGDREQIDMRHIFKEGSRSRLIDLRGDQRRIRTIQFTYRTVGNWREGKARIVIHGVK